MGCRQSFDDEEEEEHAVVTAAEASKIYADMMEARERRLKAYEIEHYEAYKRSVIAALLDSIRRMKDDDKIGKSGKIHVTCDDHVKFDAFRDRVVGDLREMGYDVGAYSGNGRSWLTFNMR